MSENKMIKAMQNYSPLNNHVHGKPSVQPTSRDDLVKKLEAKIIQLRRDNRKLRTKLIELTR